MLANDVRNTIDRVWDAFWSGGISNPLEVIEQITYLLFMRRLDINQQRAEKKAERTGRPVERPVFTPQQRDLRWSVFSQKAPEAMYRIVSDEVFPFLRGMGGEESSYAEQMKDARFTIPTPALLAKTVDMLSGIDMSNADMNGDLYEYLLSKIASSGVNGQFRTPRHIIDLMVAMADPTPQDVICDPACGTAGFLVASSEYLREHHPEVLTDPVLRARYATDLFHGYDFDRTMLRIGSMNLMLHGIDDPDKLWRFVWSNANAQDQTYFLWMMRMPAIRHAMSALASGTSGSMKNISKSKLLKMQVPLPPLSLQQEFARRVEAIASARRKVERALALDDELFASLQSRAFRGEL